MKPSTNFMKLIRTVKRLFTSKKFLKSFISCLLEIILNVICLFWIIILVLSGTEYLQGILTILLISMCVINDKLVLIPSIKNITDLVQCADEDMMEFMGDLIEVEEYCLNKYSDQLIKHLNVEGKNVTNVKFNIKEGSKRDLGSKYVIKQEATLTVMSNIKISTVNCKFYWGLEEKIVTFYFKGNRVGIKSVGNDQLITEEFIIACCRVLADISGVSKIISFNGKLNKKIKPRSKKFIMENFFKPYINYKRVQEE